MKPFLNIKNQQTFQHHRSGWAYAIQSLMPLHTDSGIRFEGFLENKLRNEIEIYEKFIGFFHNPIICPSVAGEKYKKKSLYELLKSKTWQINEKNCLGVFVLSKDLKKNLSDLTDVVCENLTHPIEMCEIKFDIEKYKKHKKCLHLGQWLRRFDSFYKIKYNGEKILLDLKTEDFLPDTIRKLNYLSNENFDNIMSESIVFNHFFDVVACNGILDCIARNTPICCNRLPATEEYLGKDYPFFFDNLNHASEIINDVEKIKTASQYISNLKKNIFHGEYFCNKFYETKLCQNIIIQKTIKLC